MKLKVRCEKNETNYHGIQARTIRGWRICCVDLLQPIRQREQENPEGGKTRAKWYKRFILYLPSGAWWNLDVVLLKPYTP